MKSFVNIFPNVKPRLSFLKTVNAKRPSNRACAQALVVFDLIKASIYKHPKNGNKKIQPPVMISCNYNIEKQPCHVLRECITRGDNLPKHPSDDSKTQQQPTNQILFSKKTKLYYVMARK